MLNWRQNTRNTKVDLYSVVILSKDDSGSYAVFTEQRSSASKKTAAKIMDIISRLPGVRRTSSGCSICFHPSEMEKMLTNYWKFQNRSAQTFGFVYHDTNGQNHGPVWKIQSFFLNGICTVILWQDCDEKGNSRKVLLKYGWEKVSKCECSIRTLRKRIILICVCGWHKIGWKETQYWSDVESTQ